MVRTLRPPRALREPKPHCFCVRSAPACGDPRTQKQFLGRDGWSGEGDVAGDAVVGGVEVRLGLGGLAEAAVAPPHLDVAVDGVLLAGGARRGRGPATAPAADRRRRPTRRCASARGPAASPMASSRAAEGCGRAGRRARSRARCRCAAAATARPRRRRAWRAPAAIGRPTPCPPRRPACGRRPGRRATSRRRGRRAARRGGWA